MPVSQKMLVLCFASGLPCVRVRSRPWLVRSLTRRFHRLGRNERALACPPRVLVASRSPSRGAVEQDDDEAEHVPVLLEEVVAHFKSRRLTSFLDCTLGAGGHAAAVIATHPEMETFIGMDVDPVAHAKALPRLKSAADSRASCGDRSDLGFFMRRTNFRNVKNVIVELGPRLSAGVDGILMDLGMSSMQVNEAARGFSFMRDGPADMRMDPTASLTAEVILNTWSEAEVGRILREYGDERRWKYLARRIVEERLAGGISTTSRLVDIIGGSSYSRTRGPRAPLKPSLHPATRAFQALRIAVNDELKSLESALSDAFSSLSVGGRLQIISFHSLEDKIVKNFFLDVARLERGSHVPEDDEIIQLPATAGYATFSEESGFDKYQRKKSLGKKSRDISGRIQCPIEGRNAKILTRRPIVPSDKEKGFNPRSRSAKLRVIEKK